MAHEPPKMASIDFKPDFGNSYRIPNFVLEHIINKLIEGVEVAIVMKNIMAPTFRGKGLGCNTNINSLVYSKVTSPYFALYAWCAYHYRR